MTEIALVPVILREWISVNDRLPEREKHVIICTSDNYVGSGLLDENGRWIKGFVVVEVKYWMPYPDAPKEK